MNDNWLEYKEEKAGRNTDDFKRYVMDKGCSRQALNDPKTELQTTKFSSACVKDAHKSKYTALRPTQQDYYYFLEYHLSTTAAG